MKRTYICVAALFMMLNLGSLQARAQLNQISSPAGPNPSDVTTPNFPGNIGDNISAPFSLSAGGNMVTFTALNGSTLYHGDPSLDTDFPLNTSLIVTQDTTPLADGPLRLDFSSSISEFGLFAQNSNIDFETFTFSAYDGGTLLGSFTTPLTDNTSANGGLGTALFLGASATAGDVITDVTISSTSTVAGGDNLFIIGPVTIGTAASAPAGTPEPSTLIYLFSSMCAVMAIRRRNRNG